MAAIASLVPPMPAKYTAGSAGSARVKRNVTTITDATTASAPAKRLAIKLPTFLSCRSALRHRAIVELRMEPVLVSLDVGLECHVQIILEKRDAWHFVEDDLDEAANRLAVFLRVGREARRLDQLVDSRVLVIHGVEHGVSAVVGPIEEIL